MMSSPAIFFLPLLFLLVFGCATSIDTGDRNISAQQKTVERPQQFKPTFESVEQKYGSSSYFVFSSSTEKEEMKINRGMAVAIFSEKNKCILLTNTHIVAGSDTVLISRWSGESQQRNSESIHDESLNAKILAESPNVDVALLEVNKLGGCNVSKIINTDPKLGTSITLYGQPVPGMGAMSRGIISGFWGTEQGRLIISDALTTNGFSGGGVFDQDQNMLGLVTGKTRDEKRGFAFIVPATRITPILWDNNIPAQTFESQESPSPEQIIRSD